MQADFAGRQVDLLERRLVIASDLQVDHALIAEAVDRLAGLGVQFDQPVAGGDIENALIAIAVGPVGNAAAGKLARRGGGARAFLHAMDPSQFAGPASSATTARREPAVV